MAMRRSGSNESEANDALGENWAASAKMGSSVLEADVDIFAEAARGFGAGERLGHYGNAGTHMSDALDINLGSRNLLSQEAAAGVTLDLPVTSPAPAPAPAPARTVRRSRARGAARAPARAANPKPPSVREKRFACEMCGQAFNKPARLKRHAETHEKIRPVYVCHVPGCDRKYTREDHLKRHMVTHEGQKRFCCQVPSCGKSFFYRYHLRRHAAVHDEGHAGDVDKGSVDLTEDTGTESANEEPMPKSRRGRGQRDQRTKREDIAAAAEYEAARLERQAEEERRGRQVMSVPPIRLAHSSLGEPSLFATLPSHGMPAAVGGHRGTTHALDPIRQSDFEPPVPFEAVGLGPLQPQNKRHGHGRELSFDDDDFGRLGQSDALEEL